MFPGNEFSNLYEENLRDDPKGNDGNEYAGLDLAATPGSVEAGAERPAENPSGAANRNSLSAIWMEARVSAPDSSSVTKDASISLTTDRTRKRCPQDAETRVVPRELFPDSRP